MAEIKKLSTRGTIVAPTNTQTFFSKITTVSQVPQSINSDIRTNPTQTVGYSGIKYPFRFTTSGRVATSTTSPTDPSHIRESIEQILLTSFRERVLLPTFGSPLSSLVFENMSDIVSVYEAQIIKALEIWEKRITIKSTQVQFDISNNSVNINLQYYINIYQPSTTYYHTLALAA